MTYLARTALSSLALCAALSSPALAQQNDDDTLIIALGSDVNTLDPHMTASVGTDLSVASHFYPALVIRGPDMKLQGEVATSWEAVDDLTWRFTLNPDAVFANGEPIDAEAVKANLERVTDPERKSRISSWFRVISEVNVIDATTIELKTETPSAALADQLSMFFLVPPAWAAENNPANEVSAGGRYILTERVPGSSITMEANPDYWGEEPPFQTVIFQIIPETAAQSAALRAGEVDFIEGFPVNEVELLSAEDGIEADAISSTRSAFLKINTFKPPMDNKLFRQALNYAVDKEAIAQSLYGGAAEVSACQWMTDDYFGFNADLEPYPYDPERAMELIAESGVDLSEPLTFEVPVGVYVQGEEASQVIAAMFEAVGVPTTLNEMSFGAFMEKHVPAKDLGQMAYLTYAWATLDADGILGLTEPGTAYDYWNNAEFGEYFNEGRSSTDPEVRMEAYRKATEVMCDDAPAVFLYAQPVTYALSDAVTWEARGDDWKRAWDFAPN
ncbi:MAG: ABC transporter substrate-binding protein [Maritimibacter sp.]|nr:ABC transporter substrate-binding protein [Maritimibacter sp.]